jgi:hypothetical protein
MKLIFAYATKSWVEEEFVHVENNGSQDVEIRNIEMETDENFELDKDPGASCVSEPCPKSCGDTPILSPGESCDLKVTFTFRPTWDIIHGDSGERFGTLTIEDTEADGCYYPRWTIPITGTGPGIAAHGVPVEYEYNEWYNPYFASALYARYAGELLDWVSRVQANEITYTEARDEVYKIDAEVAEALRWLADWEPGPAEAEYKLMLQEEFVALHTVIEQWSDEAIDSADVVVLLEDGIRGNQETFEQILQDMQTE